MCSALSIYISSAPEVSVTDWLVAGLVLALGAIATSAICLYLGVLTIQPGHDHGFVSSLVARSVFHIEVWPWLVPIGFLCISVLCLIAHALKAFGDHETKKGFGLTVAALACLIPLGYAMFVLSFFAIYTGPPKSEAELIDSFELSTGFKFPRPRSSSNASHTAVIALETGKAAWSSRYHG